MLKKDTNPKDAVGIKKAPLSTVPANVMFEVGLALLEGARKYGRHNYRAIGVRASVYYDALMRHITSWWEGEDIDKDSGLSHITKAIACLVVLRDAMMNEKWNDDRPPRIINEQWIKDLNKKAEEIIEKYPDALDPYTQNNMKNSTITFDISEQELKRLKPLLQDAYGINETCCGQTLEECTVLHFEDDFSIRNKELQQLAEEEQSRNNEY